MTPKVFVTKFQPSWNYESLMDYGEVIFLTENELRPEPAPGTYNDSIIGEISSIMAKGDYVPGRDYVATTLAMTNNVVVAMILQRTGGTHNVLAWNGRKKHYDLFKIRGQ